MFSFTFDDLLYFIWLQESTEQYSKTQKVRVDRFITSDLCYIDGPSEHVLLTDRGAELGNHLLNQFNSFALAPPKGTQ